MKDSVPILICGNAGPVGGELLRRRDIAAYWALTGEEARSVIAEMSPKLALVREGMAAEVLRARQSTSVIVLVDETGWSKKDALFAAGATALVGSGAAERILEAVSELTGLAFARYPRVEYKTAVEVRYEGESSLMETVNLSASGVAVRGSEPLPVKAGVEVEFSLLEPPLVLSALVVRSFHGEDGWSSGLCFTALDPKTRHRLEQLVQGELEQNEDALLTIDLGELEAQQAATPPESTSSENPLDELKARLREVAQEARREVDRERRPTPAPKKADPIQHLEQKLSKAERATVAGKGGPAWAETALKARLQLHLDKSKHGRASAKTVEETLVFCKSMGAQATDQAARVDVCATRAALLREIYSEPPKARYGTAAKG